MRKLLKKELTLCLHPAAVMMLFLSALVLAPNYPYAVSFFYLTLGLFFICLEGRENHDVIYTLTLPVAKRDAVTARFALTVLLELVLLALVFGFIQLRRRILPDPNAAGMDANLALLGEGFLFFGLYHLVFFPSYYRDVNKVGVSFVKGCVFSAVFVAADIVLCYTLPLMRDVLDTPDPQNLGAKLVFLAVSVAVYAAGTLLALRISQRRLEAQDIR